MVHPSAASERTRDAVAWLLDCDEPGIRLQARRDLIGQEAPHDDPLDGPRVQALLAGQESDGGFGVHPYSKWTGAHWRLVSLIELGVPPGEPRAVRAAETVLAWLTGGRRLERIVPYRGLVRRCASQEGNALAVCCRLGLAGDPRVAALAESLIAWQWPDGGWNCDREATGRRSSFHESHAPAWGLIEYHRASGDEAARAAALRTGELLLEHRVYRSLATGEPIHPSWQALHYPPYWHYDVLQGLLVLSRLGLVRDPRCGDALDLLERRRLPDGRWRSGGSWWSRPGSARAAEVVDWGRSGPNLMITLNALRVLVAAGRIEPLHLDDTFERPCIEGRSTASGLRR